jgi:arylsulfatase A-like enzyme
VIWCASIAIAGELLYWTYTKEITRYRVIGFHYLWRIPIGYSLLFGFAGALAFAAGRGSPERRIRTLVWSCAFIWFTGWIGLAFESLYMWAVLLLAAGLAWRAASAAVSFSSAFARLVRATVWPAAIVVGVLAVVASALPVIAERRAIAQLPAASPERPNVLLIVLDTVRAQSMSLHGYARDTTPSINRFAARGMVFDGAFSTAPWTLPSHASMFTGRLPHELGGAFEVPIDGRYPTLAESLSRQGYLTAAIVANVVNCKPELGLGKGFAHYDALRTSMMTSLLSTGFGDELIKDSGLKARLQTSNNFGRKNAADITAAFLDWRRANRDGQRPFFAFLNYIDAHDPYLPPPEFTRKFFDRHPNGRAEPEMFRSYSAAQVREFNEAYDGAIAFLDHHVGRLLSELEQQGDLQNTIVIITSDHGESFGEHQLMGHTASLYVQMLHVPLVIVYPARVPAARVADRVSLVNIPATVLALAGIDNTAAIPGTSLVGPDGAPAALESLSVVSEVQRLPPGYPDWYPSRRGRMRSIVMEGMHYIRNDGDKREELFDLANDPEELHDLSGDSARLQRYRDALARALQAATRR